MEHSQNIYGLFVCLFVVYRYVCIDVIITNSTIAYCLQPYLVLHRLLYMFINYFVLYMFVNYFVLQKWPSVLHRLLILSLFFFFSKVTRPVLTTICYVAKFTSTNLAQLFYVA